MFLILVVLINGFFIALFYALGNDRAREEELGRIVTVLDNKEV